MLPASIPLGLHMNLEEEAMLLHPFELAVDLWGLWTSILLGLYFEGGRGWCKKHNHNQSYE